MSINVRGGDHERHGLKVYNNREYGKAWHGPGYELQQSKMRVISPAIKMRMHRPHSQPPEISSPIQYMRSIVCQVLKVLQLSNHVSTWLLKHKKDARRTRKMPYVVMLFIQRPAPRAEVVKGQRPWVAGLATWCCTASKWQGHALR